MVEKIYWLSERQGNTNMKINNVELIDKDLILIKVSDLDGTRERKSVWKRVT